MSLLRKLFILLEFLVLLPALSYAQPYTIKGTVADTVNYNKLANASITLIHAEDSIMESFTRTKEDGSFSVMVSTPGKYILMSVFPGFVDYVDKIDVKKQVTDMGEIPMVSRTHLMQEFVFTDQFAAIKVKGDTVEYVADSFKVKDNATVEELLKKLPGLQVDKDGNIQAHGQKVEKLLVDGEEFFTDDPAVVSKSLQAKAVDKVQVFDKKSEQAEFTGIDDGEVTRTVNLQLKESMKKGAFGKIATGGGAGDNRSYFENQAMANYFKGKKKISAFGIIANTGKIGLGWEDRDKFGGGNNVTTDGNNTFTTFTNDDFETWNGKYNGQGYPKAWTGGAHYSDKWHEDKYHVAANYRYAKQNIESINNTLSQVILPDSEYFSNSVQDEFKSGQRHKVDGMYEWKTDSMSTLKIAASANYTNMISRSKYGQQNISANNDTTLNNNRLITNNSTQQRVISSLNWKKKFKKERRTLMVNLSEQYQQSDGTGFLNSVNTFVRNSQAYTQTTDQKKDNKAQDLILGGSAVYTEPITKAMAISLEYKLAVNNSTSERSTYNKANPNADTYDNLDSVYSNNYAYNIVTHTGGTNLSWDYKNLDFSTGVSAATTRFNQLDLRADTSYAYNRYNLFPKAMLRYKISKQTSIRFNYYGSTQQPTIRQVQPLKDNTNPNNISLGNSNLKQEFRNTFSLNLHDYKVLSGRWLYLYSNFNMVNNSITQSKQIDSLGRIIYQYVNVNGNYNGYAGGGIGKRITKWNMQVGGNLSTSINRTNNFVNGYKNVSNYNTYSAGINGSYETKNEKFEVSLGTDYTYNDNHATISTQATSYWTIQNNFDVSYELPWKLEVGTDFNWYVRQRTAIFDKNNNVFRWNAYISRKFLKNDQLEFRAQMFDILNQNKGFSRFASNNEITQNTYNTIRRYALVSLIWNFTKTAGGKPENSAADFIQKTK